MNPGKNAFTRTLVTGAAYGLGLAVGSVISQILFNIVSPDAYGFLGEVARVAIGLVLVMVILWIGGALAGFLGGWTLPVIGRPAGKYGYARKSMMRFGIIFSTFLFLVVFMLSLFTMSEASATPPGPYASGYARVGIIFGALFGWLLGASTLGWRRAGWVLLAGIVGFALGGACLGVGIWAYLGSTPAGGVEQGIYWYLLLGLLAFGFLGGVAIGGVYEWLGGREFKEKEPGPPSRWAKLLHYAGIGLLIVVLLYVVRPILQGAVAILTPTPAKYSGVIGLDAVGTHWIGQSSLGDTGGSGGSVGIAAGPTGEVAVVADGTASGGPTVALTVGQAGSAGDVVWDAPVDVSQSTGKASAPRVASGPSGEFHVAWLQSGAGLTEAYYAVCEAGSCSDPARLGDASASCGSGGAVSAAGQPGALDIGAGSDGEILAVWRDAGGIRFSSLPGGESGCVPLPDGLGVGAVALTAGPGPAFTLAFDEGAGPEGSVWRTTYRNAQWDASPQEVGRGHLPGIWADDAAAHVAWCSHDQGVLFTGTGEVEEVAGLSCMGRPAIAQDEVGRLHVVWQSDVVEDVFGAPVARNVLYESMRESGQWSSPVIVAGLESEADYAMANDAPGVLHLGWVGDVGVPSQVQYAQQVQYDCDPSQLSGVEQVMYSVATTGGYRPADDVIPFCDNRYLMMLFTPNSDPAFTDQPPTLNGGYDDYAELAQTAEFEVLFATMAYDTAVNHDSPGAVFADGVAVLYKKLQENPDQYPRGLLVRILLGNSPPMDTLEPNTQLWMVIQDLQEAGIDKMHDPEIGWRLEVANYAGAWPHSHVKTMVVDGKLAVASGFNHEYKPLSRRHPSGRGLDDTDTGIVIVGPVAQHTRRIYDEIWTGSVQRHCDDLTIDLDLLRVLCTDSRGVPTHVPEVVRFYPTDGGATVFSMFRNKAYDESDQLIVEAFASATESIDVAQAQFAMPLICSLNHFLEVCTFEQAPPYIENLMVAAENGAHVRLLIMPYPIQSVENVIAMKIFNEEAQARGLEDRVEIRWYNDFLHSKSALIDDEFLIVGSQNLHYGAFGEGLAEYNLGTSDPAAIDQFTRMFEHYWSKGIPTTTE